MDSIGRLFGIKKFSKNPLSKKGDQLATLDF